MLSLHPQKTSHKNLPDDKTEDNPGIPVSSQDIFASSVKVPRYIPPPL
jgi:hypothetical protein